MDTLPLRSRSLISIAVAMALSVAGPHLVAADGDPEPPPTTETTTTEPPPTTETTTTEPPPTTETTTTEPPPTTETTTTEPPPTTEATTTTTEAPLPPPIDLFVVGDSYASQGGNPGRTSPGNLVISGLLGTTVYRDYRPLPATAQAGAPVPTPDSDTVADNGGWSARGLLTDALGERVGADRLAAAHYFGFNGSLAWGWARGLPCA
jgi:hypothetical protein